MMGRGVRDEEREREGRDREREIYIYNIDKDKLFFKFNQTYTLMGQMGKTSYKGKMGYRVEKGLK